MTAAPDARLRERIAPTRSKERIGKETDPDGLLRGVVHDGNARGIGAGTTGASVSGNAGLFGTAHDVAVFGEAMRQHGTAPGGARLFGAPAAARILANQVRPEIGAHTLLFFAQGNGYCPAGDLLSPRANRPSLCKRLLLHAWFFLADRSAQRRQLNASLCMLSLSCR